MWRGRSPQRSSALASALPLLNRCSATAYCPRAAALWSGVAPHASAAVALAPLRRRRSTTSAWPFSEALWRGVALQRSSLWTCAPCFTSRRATSRCPAEAATCSGVARFLSSASTLAPCSRSSVAMGACLSSRVAAACRAVSWNVPSRASTAAPWPKTRCWEVLRRFRSTDSRSGLPSLPAAGRRPSEEVSAKSFDLSRGVSVEPAVLADIGSAVVAPVEPRRVVAAAVDAPHVELSCLVSSRGGTGLGGASASPPGPPGGRFEFTHALRPPQRRASPPHRSRPRADTSSPSIPESRPMRAPRLASVTSTPTQRSSRRARTSTGTAWS
mmetsp:Transcript_92526/g.261936  ORF Transcript_92526/g.261936 Transcript_92526/m.261936 type:complete len:328 (+) Transcript_92526:202-1185(+)